MDVPFESEKHKKLIQAIRDRLVRWRSVVSSRIREWDKAEDLYLAYARPTEEDSRRQMSREVGSPQYTTIVIPYSYATLLTAHTYWTSVFLSREPIFQFMGVHGETEQQVQALEALIDYQVRVGGMVPVLNCWLMDPGKYGYGIVGVYWSEEIQTITRKISQPKSVMGIPIPGTVEEVEVEEQIVGYQGNKLFNVRPHDFIFDPTVSLMNYQKGEFCGRIVTIGWNELRRGRYYNVEHVEKGAEMWRQSLLGSPRIRLPQAEVENYWFFSSSRPSAVEVTEFIWEIVPREWGLGDSEEPQKWIFHVAFENVIIGCEPMGDYHGKFPYFVLQYDFDPYSINPRGMLDVIRPLNEILDWLFNSHMYNVRKALNDQWLVDPSRVTMRDLREGGPGRLIRLTPEAYGTDVRTAITQFPVVDVTRSNLASLAQVIDLIQRVTGVTDNIMGVQYPGGRKTATEVRTTVGFGVNRLKTVAEFFSSSGWRPLAQVLVQNSQQYYDASRKLRVVGDLAMEARRFIEVDPETIQGFFEFVPVDGTLPVDRFAQANLWKEILIGLSQNPAIAQQYDIGRIFAWMATLAGLKNINQFRVEVRPDESVMNMVAGGQLAPAAEVLGIGQGSENGRAPEPTGGAYEGYLQSILG